MSYDPVARVHAGGTTAEDEVPMAVGVRTHDQRLFSEWLESLSASVREEVKKYNFSTLIVNIAFKPHATILDFKKVLAKHYKLPITSLRILRQGAVLADDIIVQQLGMHLVGSLDLVIRR
jgi:hypothetical protein